MTPEASFPATDTGPVAGLARSEATAPFWSALAAGELRIPRCSVCDRRFFPPRRWCPSCWSEDLVWERADGRGRVYAVTTVHVPFDPSMTVPATVALIDLEEGVRIVGRIDPVGDEYLVGSPVVITFADDPATELPVFRPVRSPQP